VTLGPTYDLVAEEVTFEAAGTTVHGTLTRPAGSGPFPALLLIAGSGPTDRDWNSTLLPGDNGSGRLLAEALGRRGVVVLRYDKRGTGMTEFSGELSWDDYLAEQRSGLALLAAHGSVERGRIYPAGHSEGGIHAVRLAGDPGTPLAGLILLATPGRTMMETVIEQIRAQIRLGGATAEKEEELINGLRTVLEHCAAGTEMDLSLLGGDLGLLSVAITFQQKAAQAFIREILVFDPAAALAGSGLPALILNGDRDMQVKPDPDADLLLAAALKAGLPVVRKTIPEADHVFKVERTAPEELSPQLAVHYNAADRELHPLLVETIAGWLQVQPRP
jgi:pimeloyl-ACP methyl ester carboxylesterase